MAIFYLQKAIDLDPEHGARTHNLLGEAYFEKKMLDQAEMEFRKAWEMSPDLAEIHYNLALIYEAKNEPSKAINEYKKEIELYPAAYQAHFNLAQLYGKLGNLREGIEHYKQAIEHNNNFANGYLFLAKAYLDLSENLDEAMRLVRKGLELAPQSEYAPLGHYILADIYNRLGQTDKYNDELRKARQLQLKIKQKSKE